MEPTGCKRYVLYILNITSLDGSCPPEPSVRGFDTTTPVRSVGCGGLFASIEIALPQCRSHLWVCTTRGYR